MEALILMILFGLISSFFGKKDEQKKKTKQMPPFNNPTVPQQPAPQRTQAERPISLEDFAQEIFGQLNDKQAEAKPTPIEVQKPVFEPIVEAKPVQPSREPLRTTSSRPPLEERPLVRKLKQEPALAFVPKNQKQMMQAVVMAEILNKPKAKR